MLCVFATLAQAAGEIKMGMRIKSTLLFGCFIVCCLILLKVPLLCAYEIEEVAAGFSVPWGMAFISDSEVMVTERAGKISLLNTMTGEVTAVKGGPEVLAEGQGGMLDVAISPGYKAGSWLYFTYVKKVAGGGATTLGRARLQGNSLLDWQDLIVTKSVSSSGHHFGSRIAFDGKGHLFFSVGDRGERMNAQNTLNHAGTILRLNTDGSIPSDNPFVDNPKILNEIYTFGHRNPQGLVFDFKTGKLWSNEHGPRGGDEINLISVGKNYGWPLASHGKEYWGPVAVGEATHLDGMEDPLKVYIPSIAPGSLLLYTGTAFPKWQGSLFSGALAMEHINRLGLDSQGKIVEEERLVGELEERIRALAQSVEGWIYFSTDSGRIMRLRPK